MRICVVLGTRPEIIKMSPIIRELGKRRADFSVLHTGQHYSYQLDKVFFDQLELPAPGHNINVGSGSHAEETGKMLIGIEKSFLREKPDVVLVEGDTNSVLAGALAAVKLGIRVGHVEAGLRSYDRTMPEEINRILTDHIADYLFAPTEPARRILLGEGIAAGRVFVTGNTIVDAVHQNLEIAGGKVDITRDFHLAAGEYFLVTLHRQENVDRADRFAAILEGLKRLAKRFGIPVIYPVHPRSLKKISEFGLKTSNLTLIDPVDFFAFLKLESQARLVLTDSGGVQEEACILQVPCVTMRDNTERPETVDVGANILAGASPERIVAGTELMLGRGKDWANPFGDGHAAEKIIDIVMEARNG